MKVMLDKDGYGLSFWCPACKEYHRVVVATKNGWKWNGSVNTPTLEPSIKVASGHYSPSYVKGDPCWCTYNAEHADDPSKFICHVCHSFVRDGRIQFLSDCTHSLAGQTVDMPDYLVGLKGSVFLSDRV